MFRVSLSGFGTGFRGGAPTLPPAHAAGRYTGRGDFTLEKELYHSRSGVVHLARDREGRKRVRGARMAFREKCGPFGSV